MFSMIFLLTIFCAYTNMQATDFSITNQWFEGAHPIPTSRDSLWLKKFLGMLSWNQMKSNTASAKSSRSVFVPDGKLAVGSSNSKYWSYWTS